MMMPPPDTSDSAPVVPPPLPTVPPPLPPVPPPLPPAIQRPPSAIQRPPSAIQRPPSAIQRPPSALPSFFWGWIAFSVVATFLVTSFLWVGGWVSWTWWQDRPQPPFLISLSHPNQAAFGELIEMEVRIHNARKHPQTLDSIDIYHSFLRGFDIVSIEPSVEHTQDIADFRTFGFGRRMEPEEMLQVRFTLRARRAGDFKGDVDVCDPEQRYTTAKAQVQVQRPPR